MFETAELGRTLSKKAYKRAEPVLREELLNLQQELLAVDHSQVIVVRSVGVERTVCEACGNISFVMKPSNLAYNRKPARTSESLEQAAGL